jgi:hypothetical protein
MRKEIGFTERVLAEMPGPLFFVLTRRIAHRRPRLRAFAGKPRPCQRTRPKTASTSAISRTKRITTNSCQIVTDAIKVTVNPETKTGIDLCFMTSPFESAVARFSYSWPSHNDMRENWGSWEKGRAVGIMWSCGEAALADLAWTGVTGQKCYAGLPTDPAVRPSGSYVECL